MAELPITYRGVVYPWHLDHMNHMNIAWYAARFDEATWQLFAMIGLTPTFMRENHCGMAAVQQKTAYKRELKSGDVITIRSKVLSIQENAIQIFHEITNDETGAVSANTELTALIIDTITRKSISFPPEILAGARTLIFSQVSINPDS
jgi:acyl-CoA thioester hydrolase